MRNFQGILQASTSSQGHVAFLKVDCVEHGPMSEEKHAT